MKHLPLFLAGALSLTASTLLAQNIVRDPGFEEDTTGWNAPYIPNDSLDRHCTFEVVKDSPHAGKACARLASEDNGRISISPKGTPIPVEPGEKFKVSLWVKAGKNFEGQNNQSGMLLRMDMMNGRDSVGIVTIDWQGQSLFLSPQDAPKDFATAPLPTKWTKVEAEFVIPEDTTAMRPAVFLWRGTGEFFIDDFIIERIR
ncbi:hypothetical protein DB345_14160 [Spartobacteria bacterium LR76]|nr:hypothetical protein DB345_14160 [Spartobacteria bacterium LR76]